MGRPAREALLCDRRRDFARRASSRAWHCSPPGTPRLRCSRAVTKKAVLPPFHVGILAEIGQSVQRSEDGYWAEITATARDNWSPMVPPPSGPTARGQARAQGQVRVRASALPRPWGAVPPDGPLP